jgi:archaemetzincin
MAIRELQLLSVGSVTKDFLAEVASPIQQVLGVSSYSGQAVMPSPAFAFNKDRNQYHTAAVLRRLLTFRDTGTPLILGVTEVDLFVPDASFVYGQADREARVAILSLNRLRNDVDGWKRRTYVEAVHLSGHLIGLSYCEDARCAMFLATTITDAERRQLHLCNNCRNEHTKLRKDA